MTRAARSGTLSYMLTFAGLGLVFGACAVNSVQVIPGSPLPTASAIALECHYRYPHFDDNALPDPACTPGDVDVRVTQSNLSETICMPGYSLRIRNERSDSYFASLKVQQMRKYGATRPVSQYEEDHLIALELGGSNDASNLWPEPAASPNPKDKIENALKTRVCAGAMSLDEAQRRIRTDWTEALK